MATPRVAPRSSPSGAPYPKTTVTLPAVAINAGLSSTITANVPGANVGDHVVVSQRAALDAGLAVSAGVYATGVVSVTVTNPSAGNITPAAPRVMSVLVLPFTDES